MHPTTLSSAGHRLGPCVQQKLDIDVEPHTLRRTESPFAKDKDHSVTAQVPRHVIASVVRRSGARALRLAGRCQKVRAEPEQFGHVLVGSQGVQKEPTFVWIVKSLVEIRQGEGDSLERDERLELET